MSSKLKVELLEPDQWQRLREIRLNSLKESPDAFGATFEAELKMEKEEWEVKFTSLDFLIVSTGQSDIAIMSVEVLDGDHGATCWIGGCWSDPQYRGQGALRALFGFLDEQADLKNWGRQGLGVWADNEDAIAAYKAIGFSEAGEKQPSERQPGRFYIHMVRDSVVN
ncbi:MAG: acetyltransferase [Actinobacteria bacterium]|jgi:RimJ/RimL family protein N-acetyltransferase|nr:acetyltransferase [Actinomycetota bacterium]